MRLSLLAPDFAGAESPQCFGQARGKRRDFCRLT
jgi:hypothetical protein